MQRLKVTVFLIFVASCVIYGGYTVKSKMIEDHKAPVITSKTDAVEISVQTESAEQEKALLEGVTAKDNRDGDLTKSIRIGSISHFLPSGKRTVSYVVFDKAGNAATLNRTVTYSDYTPPKIYLSKAFRCSTTDLENLNFTENMTAEDCLDGNLSNQIRTEASNSFYDLKAGEYKVTVQVSNSAGDVCAVPLTLTVTDSADRDESLKEYPLLSDYIVYTEKGKKLNFKKYLEGIEINGSEFTFKDDKLRTEGVKDDVKISASVDYDTPGTYPVEFSYKAEDGVKAVTTMFVVVEGEDTEEDTATEQEGEQNE